MFMVSEKLKRVFISALIAFISIGYVFSQTNAEIRPLRLTNQATGSPVSDVHIYNKDRSISSISDDDGYFDLSIFKGSDSIYFSHTSYNSVGFLYSDLTSRKKLSLHRKVSILDEFVVVASNFKEKKSDVAYLTNVINEEELKLSTSQTSADLLVNTGNILVQKSQGGGGSPNMRGFEANRILLVVDGVRMNNCIYRSGHLQNSLTIDNSILDRTEVIFGSNSVIYGSDALGGVIHYYTKNPILADTSGFVVHGQAYGRYESNGRGTAAHFDVSLGSKRVASLTSFSSKSIGDIHIGARRRPFYGDFGMTYHYALFNNGADTMLENADPEVQINTGYTQYDVLQKILVKPSQKTEIIGNVQFSTSSDIDRYDELTAYSNGLLKYAEWYYGPQNRLLASARFVLKSDNALFTNFTTTAAFQKISEDRVSRKFGVMEKLHQEEEVSVYSLSLDFVKIFSDSVRLFYGLESGVNTLESNAFYENVQTGSISGAQTRYPDGGSLTSSYAAYASYKRNLGEKLIFAAGARYSYDILTSDFIDTTYGTLPFSNITIKNGAPTGNINLVYHPVEGLQLNGIVSTGFRTPNVDDYGKIRAKDGLVTVPNSELKPEYTLNFEGGITKTFNGYINLNATVYYTLITNAIVRSYSTLYGSDSLLFDGDYNRIITNTNSGEAFIRGVSVSLMSDEKKDISFKSTVNYVYGWDVSNNAPLGHIPPLFGQTSVKFKVMDFVNEAYIVYNGWKKMEEMSPFGEDNESEATEHGFPDWVSLNARTRYSINNHFHIQFAVENILDSYYKTFASGVSAPGRNFIFTIRATF